MVAAQQRVVIYYQTTNLNSSDTSHVSLLPLITSSSTVSVTHVLVAAIHIQSDATIHLNDYPPDNELFDAVWSDVAQLQAAGVTVGGMLGGAAAGSYAVLDGDDTSFETFYAPLHDMIATYNLQGLDLDVEENMSLSGVVRLINRLKADFGSDFVITLAPVATALQEGGGNLSGFSYFDLESEVGDSISFYNAQFYDGWGNAGSTTDYQDIVDSGFPASKVNMGILTNSAEGSGFIALSTQATVLQALIAEYPDFGGVSGWEYFNSQPGGEAAPYEWASTLAADMASQSDADVTSRSFIATRTLHDAYHVVRRWVRKGKKILQ
ncbi:glycoside hydrolase superfamily [Xylariales sp. PMI_506]|nr:glycoside hydrolase superfamily [Xylariales sp. PMI_506]